MSERSTVGGHARQLDTIGLRTFSRSGYEILSDAFHTTGELAILATDGLAPLPGHEFTVDVGGFVQDVIVGQVTEVPGGWAAICRAW